MREQFIDTTKHEKSKRGVISIESCISLFVFLLVFILFFNIYRIMQTEYRFNETVNEAVLKTGHNAYFQDVFADGAGALTDYLSIGLEGVSPIIKGIIDNTDINETVSDITDEGIDALKRKIALQLLETEIKKNASINKLEPDKIEITCFKMTQSLQTFYKYTKTEVFKNLERILGKAPAPNDIIVTAVYNKSIKIPFINKTLVGFSRTAAVKGWTGGSYRIYSGEINGDADIGGVRKSYSDDEKSDPFYIYHVEGSRKYHDYLSCTGLNFADSVRRVPRSHIWQFGYELCRNCERKYLRKDGRIPDVIYDW